MKRRLLALSVAFLIALAGELMWKLMLGRATADGAAAKTSSNAHPVPVTVGLADRGTIPVYLTGLGTVQAFNTVTNQNRGAASPAFAKPLDVIQSQVRAPLIR
jgi:multidrug efflux system membrane fusion protein